MQKKYRETAELADVELVAGFNPAGNPVFQQLAQARTLTESQYITIWKGYLLSLVGNWLLEIYEGNHTSAKMKELDRLLRSLNLRIHNDSANTIFSGLMNVIRYILHPTAAEVGIELSPEGEGF